jgi:hypothetical protein
MAGRPSGARRRNAAALACAAAVALAAAGCGLGAGKELEGDGAQLRVTRDFGHELIGKVGTAHVREDETVMRLLRSRFDVDTRYGGRFVQSIGGLEGRGAGGRDDWFFFVNGLESDEGAGEFELSPGDRVQWDYRRWDAAMRVPAIVGAFPEPFLHGIEGERRPVRLECDDAADGACREAERRLEHAGVSSSGASLGAPYTSKILRMVVATWPRARIVRGAASLEQGPQRSGVFARFTEGGRALELLDESGEVARTVRPGDGTALVTALRPRPDELAWLVTGLDEKALEAGARALTAGALRDAFAVAVTGSRVDKLPLEAP